MALSKTYEKKSYFIAYYVHHVYHLDADNYMVYNENMDEICLALCDFCIYDVKRV